MYIDIVFPSKNETKFIHLASLLGYGGLCLVYSSQEFSQKKIEELQSQTPLKLYGLIITPKTKTKSNTALHISESKNEQNNRQILDKGNIDVLFNLENQPGNDFIHQRNSGLNHILCKLANKNQTAIGVSFSNLLHQSFNPQTIGRINQNLSLCKKYKVKTIFASFAKSPSEMRPPHDLTSLFSSLGAEKHAAREAILTLHKLLESNKTKISKDVHLL